MLSPVVSVGMPFLNAAKYIHEAVDSVLAQTYPRWELLLVDDGSTDSSSGIAKGYAARHPDRIQYLRHADGGNHGISAARNLALRSARGKYIGFLDADDVWLPHKLGRQVGMLESNPAAQMVYGHYQYWYSWTGRPEDQKRDFTPPLGVEPGLVMTPPALLTRLYPLGEGRTPSMSDLLVSRALALEIGGFEEQFGGLYEDHAFLVKVYLNGSVIASDECWDKYRIHPESCQSRGKNDLNYQAVRRQFFKWLEAYFNTTGVADAEIWHAYRAAIERRKTVEEHYAGWLFRVAPGNEAYLVAPSDSPDTLRVAIEKCETAAAWDVQLNRPRVRVEAGQSYRVCFRARADAARTIGVGVAIAAEPWSNLGIYQAVSLTPGWQSWDFKFTAVANEENARIHFDAGGCAVAVEVAEVSLRTIPS